MRVADGQLRIDARLNARRARLKKSATLDLGSITACDPRLPVCRSLGIVLHVDAELLQQIQNLSKSELVDDDLVTGHAGQ